VKSQTARIGIRAAGAVLFVGAHTQAPLYWSNQNQYFLHGLAAGGYGNLHRDWLANTADPTPAFSALVEFTIRHGDPRCFHVLYAMLLALYFLSLMALASRVPHGPRSPLGELRLAVGLIVIHSAVIRWVSVQLLGGDYPWFLQSGVANQYVLGPGLQPSVFGVLLVAAIAAFACDRLLLTGLFVAGAAAMHPTYLLPGALLMLGFLHVLWWENCRGACVLLGIGTLALVTPIVVHGWRQFAPTSPESVAEAERILVDFRLPHHARIDHWLDVVAAAQVVWIAIGILLVRKSRLFMALVIAFGLAAGLTLLQWSTGNRTLALLFPWRLSAVLMPVATTINLARTITVVHPGDERDEPASAVRFGLWPATLAVIALGAAVAGPAMQACGLFYGWPDDEQAVYEFAAQNAAPGDCYLVPVVLPDPAQVRRGSPSTTFVPSARSAEQNKFAPDWQRFRLATGVPIYVDFKSLPYRDVEVVEWRRRISRAVDWQDQLPTDDLRQAGVTHVIAPAGKPFEATQFERVFQSGQFLVLRLRPGAVPERFEN
jgi:hypothetical protein